jgi:hypothetical protein
MILLCVECPSPNQPNTVCPTNNFHKYKFSLSSVLVLALYCIKWVAYYLYISLNIYVACCLLAADPSPQLFYHILEQNGRHAWAVSELTLKYLAIYAYF